MSLQNKKVVIVGASGFVARNTRKFLSDREIDLISISRNNFKQLKNETKIVSKSYDEDKIISQIKNSDALFHLAGSGKQTVNTDFNCTNVEFTKHIINLCKKSKIKKIVYLSGLGANPNASVGYFISKFKAEQIIISSGIAYNIFRPSFIIGKDDYLTNFLKKQIKKRKIIIPGSGNFSIQPIYINDVLEIFFQSLLNNKFENETLDLVGPELFTYKQYAYLFSKENKTIIQRINIEKLYEDTINNKKTDFEFEDLNILLGNFKGNHTRLKKKSNVKFHSVRDLLNSCTLL